MVRVLLVFRALVLLITIVLLPAREHTFVVGVAEILAAIVSFVPLRHWSRVARSLSRHPAYLAIEVVLTTLILAAAGAHSSFFFFTLGTAALAGIVYGRRGAIPFTVLLVAAYEFVALEGLPTGHPLHDVQSIVLMPLLYPAAIAAGIAARELVERGVRAEALLAVRTEEIAAERERLRVAREMHDSLAKTVEGLGMTASVLPRRCERDPAGAAQLARALAADAQQAAREARALMGDLRSAGNGAELPLAVAVTHKAEEFARRAGVAIHVSCLASAEGAVATAELPAATSHELLRILGEALNNAVRHGGARNVTVALSAGEHGDELSISDDGCGLERPPDLDRLKSAGHFGLAGMNERARAIGGTLTVTPGAEGGTTVTATIPRSGAAAAVTSARAKRPWRRPARRGRSAGAGMMIPGEPT